MALANRDRHTLHDSQYSLSDGLRTLVDFQDGSSLKNEENTPYLLTDYPG